MKDWGGASKKILFQGLQRTLRSMRLIIQWIPQNYGSELTLVFKCFVLQQSVSNPEKIDNITGLNGAGLFACEKITFAEPFPSGKQVKVFASPSNSSTGAALWVESEDKSQFSACIYEYSDGSNAIEINWIALQSAPSGAQIGTTSLDSWTTGTECKKIYFPQVSCAIHCMSIKVK